MNHFVFCLVAVFEVLVALFVLPRFLVFFFFSLDGPTALRESLRDLLVGSQDVRGHERELMCHIMVVFVSGVKRSILDKFLERLSLAHELDKLGISCLALVEAVFVLFEEIFESAAALLGEQLVDFALGDAVLVTTESMNMGGYLPCSKNEI